MDNAVHSVDKSEEENGDVPSSPHGLTTSYTERKSGEAVKKPNSARTG